MSKGAALHEALVLHGGHAPQQVLELPAPQLGGLGLGAHGDAVPRLVLEARAEVAEAALQGALALHPDALAVLEAVAPLCHLAEALGLVLKLVDVPPLLLLLALELDDPVPQLLGPRPDHPQLLVLLLRTLAQVFRIRLRTVKLRLEALRVHVFVLEMGDAAPGLLERSLRLRSPGFQGVSLRLGRRERRPEVPQIFRPRGELLVGVAAPGLCDPELLLDVLQVGPASGQGCGCLLGLLLEVFAEAGEALHLHEQLRHPLRALLGDLLLERLVPRLQVLQSLAQLGRERLDDFAPRAQKAALAQLGAPLARLQQLVLEDRLLALQALPALLGLPGAGLRGALRVLPLLAQQLQVAHLGLPSVHLLADALELAQLLQQGVAL
mmetsp:Transcript_2222/g.6503  ORF Transcript_2222/g.6503 Transcript_2222/m.6503 type:complete len:381 (+) Transcript_2222:739-1881(+)